MECAKCQNDDTATMNSIIGKLASGYGVAMENAFFDLPKA